MEMNKILPPVDLYKIKDEYYVLDGNHRVAAARQLQQPTIAAHVVEYLPSKQTLENILYREKTNFELSTGLANKLELTEVGQFGWLLEQIKEHQTSLAQLTASQASLKGAAEDWYHTVYMPLVDIIKHGGLEKAFPKRTLADLYVYISYHQWHKGREDRKYGGKLDELIPNSMEKFRVKVMEQSEHPFPEMKQVTTAFIMISVTPELEQEIVEKLYAYEEVKELHYVPVDFDVIAKIVLERDLLSSESEVVRQFVQRKVRRIPGVTWTQTIITLASKIKNR
jgi:DNA-binding Lrp family transcriptional regulator